MPENSRSLLVLYFIFAILFFSPVAYAHEEETIGLPTQATLTLSNENPAAGETVTLDLYLADSNDPVTDLETVSEKLVHAVGLRDDLTNFFHIHPLPDTPGHYLINHTFVDDGEYALWTEFTRNDDTEVHK